MKRMDKHPAKCWPNTWLFDDRSEQSENIQIIDLLTDIRLFLFLIWLLLLVGGLG